MNILVVNAGSSSVKYKLYNMDDGTVLASGMVERIGFDSALLSHKNYAGDSHQETAEILDHSQALQWIIKMLEDEFSAVGHRVVHGGESFSNSVLITPDVKLEIKRLFELAPLHNPAHLKGILAVERLLPNLPQVAVFDTAFHQTMEPEAYLYPVPYVLYKKHQVRRYGFHGTSHAYVSKRASEMLGKEQAESFKVVTCHIGNGASCAAILNGKSIDTSMGLTPLEGLMMGTRSGDLDPASIPYIMAKEDLSIAELNSMLNKHSGMIGISGISSDFRDIVQAMDEGDSRAKLAFDMYVYRLVKYIGSYAAALNGIDALIFTAGVGENSALLRSAVCEHLTFMGLELDPAVNEAAQGKECIISSPSSKVTVLVIPTHEEWVIARDTYEIVAGLEGEEHA